MTALAYLIPVIFAIILLIFFHKKVVWWEYLILIVPSVIITAFMYFGMVSYSESDTEYFGDYATGIRYYEPWDEYIHRTCTRTVGSGKNQHTESYDCSYIEYHDEEWKQVLSNGYEYSISKAEYNRLFNMWHTPNAFVDMHRHYHHKDGDMYSKNFDGLREHAKTRTTDHEYKNKIKASYSIFGFTKIDKDEAKEMHLYDYPELYEQSKGGLFSGGDINQSPFLGYKPTAAELQRWQFINGFYGPKKEFRVYLLFFYNKPQTIVQDQRSYWQGGNKNEMILCFGMDSVSKKIQWVDAFSWCDKPTFEVYFRSYFNGKDKLDLMKLADWTEYAARNYWVRKHFEDFDYIDVELSQTQLTWLFIIVFLVNAGLSVWIILNDIEYDEHNNIIT